VQFFVLGVVSDRFILLTVVTYIHFEIVLINSGIFDQKIRCR